MIILLIIVVAFYCYKQFQKNRNIKTVNPNEINQGPIIHNELSHEQIEKIKKIQATFADVYKISLEETITNFKRDRNPDNEIEIWLNMVHAYEKFILKDSEITLNKKSEVFKLILMRSMMDEKEAIKETDCKILNEKEITEILSYYIFKSAPLLIK
ncbi:hypothetical protein [Flavobacterium hydrophilum]|uniref:Uncharacterized protein n=1 Tax=Flavobacterium hydrophilum TaxID=2211445 RepID=A0A2V4C3H3_9FLAO|nr:hypothetical protein [Flavobacterium hydrophilum]PXY44460.1 hypothetical protein DMB68_13410 [Flavobacterium hydrophilum]